MAGKGIELASAYVSLSVSTDKIPGQIKQALRGLDNQSIDVDVDADTKGASENLSRWRAEEANNRVNVKVDVDTKDASSQMQKLRKDLDFGPGALSLNLGAVAIAGLPALAAGLGTVASAVQEVAQSGLVLPGLFAGIGASVGTAALGMSGMSDALKAVNKSSDGTAKSIAAANDALSKLSPNAADVVRTVGGLNPVFEDLRNTVSQNLFAGTSNDIRRLVDADLPHLKSGFAGVATSLNKNIHQLGVSLGSASSTGFLDRIFGNTADAQARLTHAIDPVIHAFGTLAAAGSATLPKLADGVGKLADRFDAFITAADSDGRLDKWINDGITALENLGGTALNIGKSFTAITQAAGGGDGLLGTLNKGSAALATFLNSSQGQADLKKFFQEGRDELSKWMPFLQSLPGLFQGVYSASKQWTDAILPPLGQIAKFLGDSPKLVQDLATAFVAWKTIDGVTSLMGNLGKVSTLLRVTLPADALVGAGGISTALAGVSLPAWVGALTDLASLLFQENHARDDDNAHGRTAELPVGPHGLPVGVKPGPQPGYGNGTAAPQNQPPAATNDIPSRGRFPAPNSPVLPGAAVAPPPGAAPALQWPGGPVPGAPMNPLLAPSASGPGAPSNFSNWVAPSGFDYHGHQDVANTMWQAYNQAGMPASEWGDFVNLENSEAGWQPSVRNPKSGAYGVAQFLGTDNINTFLGGDPNAPLGVQSTGMMQYLKSRYHGSPSDAWQFHQANDWYSSGGGVWGAGTAKSDSIPAMLSNGEHVLTADDVNAMGGQNGVYAFRQALHRAGGGEIPTAAVPYDPNTTQGPTGNWVGNRRILWWGGKDGIPAVATPDDPSFPWGPNKNGKMIPPNIFGGLPGENPPNNDFPKPGDSRSIWWHNRRGVGTLGASAMPGFADGGALDLRKLFKDDSTTGQQSAVDPNTTQHGTAMGAAPGPVGADGQPTDAAQALNAPPSWAQNDSRTQGYIPSGAGSNSVAGTSFVSGLLNMGAEAINGVIDQAASAASTAASVGVNAVAPGAGGAAGSAAQFGIGLATTAAKRGVSYAAQMLGIGADSLIEQLFPVGGPPRWLGYDYTQFAPHLNISPAAVTTGEKAIQALGGQQSAVDPNTTQHGLGMGAAPGPVAAPGGPVQPGQLSGVQQPIAPPQPAPFNAPTPQQPAPDDDLLKRISGGVYDTGGILDPNTAAINLSNSPEYVLTPQQWKTMERNARAGGDTGGSGSTYNVYANNTEDAIRQLKSRERLNMMQYAGRP